ncbi:hypothetical protein QTP86_028493, partial [Hemibagrus guttatus]
TPDNEEAGPSGDRAERQAGARSGVGQSGAAGGQNTDQTTAGANALSCSEQTDDVDEGVEVKRMKEPSVQVNILNVADVLEQEGGSDNTAGLNTAGGSSRAEVSDGVEMLFSDGDPACSQIEQDEEPLEDNLSDLSDISVSQFGGDQQLYTLTEINESLDETFGKSVEVKDYFPDINTFIASVVMAQRTASYEELDKKKRYRLKNHLVGYGSPLTKESGNEVVTLGVLSCLHCCSYLFFLFLLLVPPVEKLKIGSLNISGGRDRNKRAVVKELIQCKKIDVIFLQETHSDQANESDWAMWGEGKLFHSHGTNVSAGVAILFNRTLGEINTRVTELEQGRVLMVQTEVRGTELLFINVYAPNSGGERAQPFNKLKNALQHSSSRPLVVMGGDWNCTTDFALDRNGEEPHPQSAKVLLISQCSVVDVWREQHQGIKQYTWVKVTDTRITAARLDSTNFIPDQSRPELTTTAIGAIDLQGGGGNWATVGGRSRGGRRVHRQREKRKGKSVGLRIGTLSVGTMTGKGRELADVMERRKVDILCVQETRWKGSKARSIGAGFKLFYYGVDSKRNGVGVVLKEEFVRNVLEVKRVSDRVMSLKLEIEGVMLNVVSGYAPQVGCELEEKERFWSELDEVMESIPTGERVVMERILMDMLVRGTEVMRR